jgi:hypothetical protein
VLPRHIWAAKSPAGHWHPPRQSLPLYQRSTATNAPASSTSIAPTLAWALFLRVTAHDDRATAGSIADLLLGDLAVLKPHNRPIGSLLQSYAYRPCQDHPSVRAVRAAQNDRRMLVRVVVEVLLRTGLRILVISGANSRALPGECTHDLGFQRA